MNDDLDDYSNSVDREEAWNVIAARDAEITSLHEQLAEALNQLDSARHDVTVLERRVCELMRQRDAARAGALEEAARKIHWMWNADGTPVERRVAEETQAAIRALIPQPAPTIGPAEAATIVLARLLELAGGKTDNYNSVWAMQRIRRMANAPGGA